MSAKAKAVTSASGASNRATTKRSRPASVAACRWRVPAGRASPMKRSRSARAIGAGFAAQPGTSPAAAATVSERAITRRVNMRSTSITAAIFNVSQLGKEGGPHGGTGFGRPP